MSAFEYANEWMRSDRGRPLSLSLPFHPAGKRHAGPAVEFFFDNLLPDSPAIRGHIRDQLSLRSTGSFDLLGAIGADCVGAIQLLPSGVEPVGWDRIEAIPLTEADIELRLNSVASNSPISEHQRAEFRFSALAGYQEKSTLMWHDNRWHAPRGATPSTHIVKLPLGLVGKMRADFHASVENEWLCRQTVAAFGLPIAECEIARFGAVKALVVERFDRQLAPGGAYWLRLPQEDMCQALGVAASRKYESDGGPGIADILRVLAASDDARADRRRFFKAQVLFWMLAATDGHAKNFSIRVGARGRYRACPLYDVLSAWPIIGRRSGQLQWQDAKLAMAARRKNAHYRVAEIRRGHWEAMASNHLGESAEPIIAELLTDTPMVIERVGGALRNDFPAEVSDRIFDGLLKSAKRLGA